MLHQSLTDPTRIAALTEEWKDTGCIRVSPILDEDTLDAALAAMQVEGVTIKSGHAPLRYQYFQLLWQPGAECTHVLCAVGRWLWDDGLSFVSRITGRALEPPVSRAIHCSLYTRGCYLDPHNDYDKRRSIAFVLGMTKNPLPPEAGGHLEFLDQRGRDIVVRERRAPGWNTLDLFDVSEPLHIHRVPLVTEPMDRRAITGWLYPAGHAEAEAAAGSPAPPAPYEHDHETDGA